MSVKNELLDRHPDDPEDSIFNIPKGRIKLITGFWFGIFFRYLQSILNTERCHEYVR